MFRLILFIISVFFLIFALGKYWGAKIGERADEGFLIPTPVAPLQQVFFDDLPEVLEGKG